MDTQRPWVRFSAFPINYRLMLPRFIEGTALNSGQRLDNVNRTNLVLASGKLALQKKKKETMILTFRICFVTIFICCNVFFLFQA